MGSMLPLFTLGFATMSTLVAVTLVYATDRLVIDCSSKRGPRSLTAIVFKRWHEILASGVGLGVAAGWDDTLERLVSIEKKKRQAKRASKKARVEPPAFTPATNGPIATDGPPTCACPQFKVEDLGPMWNATSDVELAHVDAAMLAEIFD